MPTPHVETVEQPARRRVLLRHRNHRSEHRAEVRGRLSGYTGGCLRLELSQHLERTARWIWIFWTGGRVQDIHGTGGLLDHHG